MREIFKYGSVRGVMFPYVYKLNKLQETSMSTLHRFKIRIKLFHLQIRRKISNPLQVKF